MNLIRDAWDNNSVTGPAVMRSTIFANNEPMNGNINPITGRKITFSMFSHEGHKSKYTISPFTLSD